MGNNKNINKVQHVEEANSNNFVDEAHDILFLLMTIYTCGIFPLLFKRKQQYNNVK